MISKSYLLKTLNGLDKLYNSSRNDDQKILYSKLALIELCGWIEETMDDIILRCAKRCLKSPDSQKFVKDKIIKPNYNFQYEDFRKMLMTVIGLAQLEKIEKKLEKTGKISALKGDLGNLKNSRNQAAHTYTKGTLRTYDAPSKIKNDFTKIYVLLKELDEELIRNNC
jgi:RiboL-PSP-HEPN